MENSNKYTDSAGVPWAGRTLRPNSHAADDGSADEQLINVLALFRDGKATSSEVFEVICRARLLIPLVASLAEADVGVDGLKVDKSAELSIVTVQAPDGQLTMPVFSSVAAMAIWNPNARPVPNNARAIALAAASEGNSRIVLDPMSETEIVIRRPAIEAMAKGLNWLAPENNPAVLQVVARETAKIKEILNFRLVSGDPSQKLFGPELSIEIFLKPGLQEAELLAIETQLSTGLASDVAFVSLVDSVAVRFLAG